MGGGIIAATLGIIVAIIAAIFGILYFPIKRFMKNRKKKINEQK
jgi:F0F1-type ATP synthase membrane subunit b/b'